MTNVESRMFQKKLIYKGTVILKYKIEFPQIKYYDQFNLFNLTKALELQKKCETEFFEQAKKTYDYNVKNNYPIMVYEIVSDFLVTYEYMQIISLFIDDYAFLGGAHGNTVRTSQTWNLENQKMMKLEDFFPNNPNYISKILKNINQQIEQNIKKGNNIYFENYCCLTSENFRVENYYINNGMIIIYYQQYDIGPYSSGIINFYINK